MTLRYSQALLYRTRTAASHRDKINKTNRDASCSDYFFLSSGNPTSTSPYTRLSALSHPVKYSADLTLLSRLRSSRERAHGEGPRMSASPWRPLSKYQPGVSNSLKLGVAKHMQICCLQLVQLETVATVRTGRAPAPATTSGASGQDPLPLSGLKGG